MYKVLECPELTVWIVNARHIKYVPGHKTDKKISTSKQSFPKLPVQTGIPQRQEAGIVGDRTFDPEVNLLCVLKTNVFYKELGADYVRKQREEKRKAYLKKEMEALGYEVDLKKVV